MSNHHTPGRPRLVPLPLAAVVVNLTDTAPRRLFTIAGAGIGLDELEPADVTMLAMAAARNVTEAYRDAVGSHLPVAAARGLPEPDSMHFGFLERVAITVAAENGTNWLRLSDSAKHLHLQAAMKHVNAITQEFHRHG